MKREKELRRVCRQLVPRVLEKWGWELVQDEYAFIEQVLAEVQRRLPKQGKKGLSQLIQSATIHCYCPIWYEACRAKGTRQSKGLTELGRYMQKVALGYCQNDTVAQEGAQMALIKVWENLDTLKEPTRFMGWARTITIRTVITLIRAEIQKVTVALEEEREPSDAGTPATQSKQGNRLAMMSDKGVSGLRMTREIWKQVEAAIRSCLRSLLRQEVIIGAFVVGKTLQEIASELDKKSKSIHEAKSKALRQLQKCEKLLTILEAHVEEWERPQTGSKGGVK